jgi:hypothetical protein
MVKLVAAFHLAALCLNAGLIVSGTAPGMLAQASLAIPTDPNMQPIPTMRDSASGFWSGTVTVLGGSGSGFLYFNMMAFGESFGGSPSSEYMDSYAGITSTVGSVASQLWLPQGSTPAQCNYCGNDVLNANRFHANLLGLPCTPDKQDQVTSPRRKCSQLELRTVQHVVP